MRRFTRPRRGFKQTSKAIKHLKRYQHYHNSIKNHSALGMSPAQNKASYGTHTKPTKKNDYYNS